MHIPDGYLSPATFGFFYAVMIAIWAWASRVLKKVLELRQVPILALGSAFSFVIMMFNIPVPGGSTGHATGGALLAIVLGPWAALISISIALFVQAVIFGDGGLTTFAANSFNIAFIMPFSGYYLYKLICIGKPSTARKIFAAGFAGYISLNLAAIFTGIELGLQPLIASKPDGQPLYAPYPLKIAVPAMALEHLILFGFIEAAVTSAVISYILKNERTLLYTEHKWKYKIP